MEEYIQSWKDPRLLRVYGIDLLTLLITAVILVFYGSAMVKGPMYPQLFTVLIGLILLSNWSYLKSMEWSRLLARTFTPQLFWKSLVLHFCVAVICISFVWIYLLVGYISLISIVHSVGLSHTFLSIVIALTIALIFVPIIVYAVALLDRLSIAFYTRTRMGWKINQLQMVRQYCALMIFLIPLLLLWNYPLSWLFTVLLLQFFFSWQKLAMVEK